MADRFRLAAPAAAAALLAVYAPYIETGVTFETAVPSAEEFTRRVTEITRDFPYILCEREGEIIGYAYAHPAFTRAAYRWDAEATVYLAPALRGERLGEELYRRLLAILPLQNIRTVYALVTSPNPRSERFHERMGFSRTAYLPETGYKRGQWWGVSWYEKRFPAADPPEEPVGIGAIPTDVLARILETGE